MISKRLCYAPLSGSAIQRRMCGPFPWGRKSSLAMTLRYDTDAYRTVVAVQLGKLYVLHAFQKTSKSGIATPKPDVDLIRQRYAEARELAKHED